MTSNEHPDMNGNACDEPITCDQCKEPFNKNNLYGTVLDEEAVFCSAGCVEDFEETFSEE